MKTPIEFACAVLAFVACGTVVSQTVSPELKPLVRACAIDKAPRRNERPSDHAPVVVEIALA